MRELLNRNWRFFTFLTLVALAFRLFFVFAIPVVAGDSLVYADIAKNFLNHGIYGLSTQDGVSPTLIRLPGYPFFLALIFKIFGQDHWRAVMLIQAFVDVGTCFIIAALARRCINERAAKIAFVMAALCPFTANYTGTPLTETLSLFFIALGLMFAVWGLAEYRMAAWIGCGIAVACAIQLRPDGGWLLMAIGGAVLIRFWIIPGERKQLLRGGSAILLISLTPLVPWTIRNWKTFHVFQPLVTVEATDPGEWSPLGWIKWLKTWSIDYSSAEDLGFRVDGEPINIGDVPNRAFSNEDERQQVSTLFDRYNRTLVMSPELDSEFATIVQQKNQEHPFSQFVLLPIARLAAIWLRPRTEMLPLDTHWWNFREDPHDSLWAVLLLLLNLAYIGLALRGLLHGPPMRFVLVLLLYLVIRSAFLMWMGAIEDRYTLEGYPCLIVLGARYLAGLKLAGQEDAARRPSLAGVHGA